MLCLREAPLLAIDPVAARDGTVRKRQPRWSGVRVCARSPKNASAQKLARRGNPLRAIAADQRRGEQIAKISGVAAEFPVNEIP